MACILAVTSAAKRPPVKHTCSLYDDNIKIDLKDDGCEDVGGFNWLRIGGSDSSCKRYNETEVSKASR